MAITELTDKDFDDKITHADGKVLLYFWATWCGHCQHMTPTLEWVQDTIGDSIHFYKVDVDKAQHLAMKYAVRSVPTLMLFKDGELVKRSLGSMTKEQLTTWLI